MDQLLRADKELWQRVASHLPSLPTVNAAATVHAAIKARQAAPSVSFHVLPLPKEKKRTFDEAERGAARQGQGRRQWLWHRSRQGWRWQWPHKQTSQRTTNEKKNKFKLVRKAKPAKERTCVPYLLSFVHLGFLFHYIINELVLFPLTGLTVPPASTVTHGHSGFFCCLLIMWFY